MFQSHDPAVAWTWLVRRMLGSARGWDLDFRSRTVATQIFEEGAGPLLTDGSHACMDHDHLAYDTPLSHGERGLLISMDAHGSHCGAVITTGHLASFEYLPYGDFSWRARVHRECTRLL